MNDPKSIADLKARMAWEQARENPPPDFPALPPLAPGRYTNDEFYELEQRHLWSQVWLYAAHLDQLPDPGDYLLLEIPNLSAFLIHGADGEIRAFYNVCSHRGAPLVRAPSGNSASLRCTYHQWTYDTQGDLIAVMDERDFPAPFDKSCLGLQAIRCERWGNWIFVSESEQIEPLTKWLGAINSEFHQFEIEKLRPVEIKHYEVQCNWKLTMDAFLEVYHINGIHPKTVAPSLDHRGAVMTLFPNGHTRMTCPTNATPKQSGARQLQQAGSMPRITNGEIASTYHVSHNVFPNLITPTSDSARQFLMFWPITKTRTRVDVAHFGADWGAGERPSGWEAYLEFWDVIMAEDLQFLEWQQQAVLSKGFKGYRLSYMERRIYYAHEAIDKAIGVSHIPEALRVDPRLARFIEQ
ncbi:MAG: aromatic ring-hydroxylating dioxygenase subunit alpha [Pseudomonadales bacterium]|nr:aromatic ring-hydroxylating dioxygenase subunit alpha [Pseudomonadales bacterium]